MNPQLASQLCYLYQYSTSVPLSTPLKDLSTPLIPFHYSSNWTKQYINYLNLTKSNYINFKLSKIYRIFHDLSRENLR